MLTESLAGILQRPGRSVLTMLGTVLGVGAFVAILGLTATASGQIDKRFSALSATQVTIEDTGTTEQYNPMSFTTDADQRVEALNGVVHAGVYWPLPLRNPTISAIDTQVASNSAASAVTAYAADAGALAAMKLTIASGETLSGFLQDRGEHVAIVGSSAASILGISRLAAVPAVFVNGTPYTVVGIFDEVARLPQLLNSIVIPAKTALAAYGEPTDQRAKMIIETRLGAAQLIAWQAPLALRPDASQLFKSVAPPDPKSLQQGVAHDLNALFLLLAAISLVIGTVGIANTTLVAVLERTNEIGLRRALGARPRHIAYQFLVESMSLGTLGGLVGTSLGVGVVLSVAIGHHWTAIMQPWAVLPAPLIGTIVGFLAGAYPSIRAAAIEPVEALRR